jgi:c-di-GMP-binding flagellar brake protein YcgR
MPRFKLKITQPKKKTQTSESSGKTDRRKSPRVNLDTKVRYQVLGHPSKEVLAQNISAGGMCLLLDRKISPRMILELEFKLPGNSEELITTYAEVIWQSNSHTGIKFISI